MDYTVEPPPQKFTVEPPKSQFTVEQPKGLFSRFEEAVTGEAKEIWGNIKAGWEQQGKDLAEAEEFYLKRHTPEEINKAYSDPNSAVRRFGMSMGLGFAGGALGAEAGMAKPIAESADLRPAAKAPTGEITVGTKGSKHDDIVGITPEHERGFMDSQGKFLSREEAGARAKAAGLDVPTKLHSEDLNKAQAPSKGPLPPSKMLETPSSPKFTVEKPPPGPMLDLPKEGEKVEATATRVDDSLFRVRQNNQADKIEAKRFLKDTPRELSDPRLQERLYTEIENQMVNPAAKLSPEAAKAAEYLKPWKTEESALFKNLKDRGLEDLSDVPLDEAGYVHRVARGKGHPFDPQDPEGYDQANPIVAGRGSLSQEASGLHHRNQWVLQRPDGSRIYQPKPDPKWKPGVAIKGTDGRMYTPKLATTEEIERGSNHLRYYKNALVNTVDNVLRLRRVKRNLDLLDQLKPQLTEGGLAVKAGGKAPPNYITTTLPQFMGWKFEPKIANVLNDFHGELLRGGAVDKILAKVNNVIVRAMFMMPAGPIAHGMNVLNHFIVGRGWDWVQPVAYARLLKNGTKAIKAVATMDENEIAMLREGSALVYPSVENENFYEMMIKKAGTEQMFDTEVWEPLSKTLGFDGVADLVKWEAKAMAKGLWSFSDVLMLTRQFELMDKGMPVRQAIREAEKDIPNYRVPSEVMGSRPVAEALKSPRYLLFSRYKYGVFKAYSEMIKPLVGKATGEARKEALGKLMALGILAFAVYPLADLAWQIITGNKKAKVYRRGPMSIPQAAYDLSQGEKEWVGFMSSVLTPAPLFETGMAMYSNKDVFGRNIIEPGATLTGKLTEAGEEAAGLLDPFAEAEKMMKPGGLDQFMLRQLGVKSPTPEQEHGKAVGKRIERKQAGKREKKDPIEQSIKKALGL